MSVLGAKEQLAKENEELKLQREELEVRMSALKSQYEGRLSRQERELRELREQQERHGEQRDDAQEPGQSKVWDHKQHSLLFVEIKKKFVLKYWSKYFWFLSRFKRHRDHRMLARSHSSLRLLLTEEGNSHYMQIISHTLYIAVSLHLQWIRTFHQICLQINLY